MGCKGQRLFLQAERAGGTLEAVPSFLSPTQQQWEQQQLSATYPPPGKSYWGPAPRSCKIQESEASFVLPIDKPGLTICNWNHSKEYSIAMRSSMNTLLVTPNIHFWSRPFSNFAWLFVLTEVTLGAWLNPKEQAWTSGLWNCISWKKKGISYHTERQRPFKIHFQDYHLAGITVSGQIFLKV